MLYNTHKRYGQVSALIALPVVAHTELIEITAKDIFSTNNTILNFVVLTFFIMVAIKSSMFGAEFPDLDSPGSTPARKHKFLAFIFRVFRVKHRGKFSHDFVSQSLLWGSILGIVTFLGEGLGSSSVGLFIITIVKISVIFSFVGVLSHLVADAMTVDGVWFAWKFKVRFMPVFIRKIGIGSFKPFSSWFTTDSKWNNVNYWAMTILLPIVGLFSIVSLYNII